MERLATIGSLLDGRAAAGKVRRGHGGGGRACGARGESGNGGRSTQLPRSQRSLAAAAILSRGRRRRSQRHRQVYPSRSLGPGLGAPVLRSDVIRKRLFDVAPETRLPASAYTPQVSRRVYRALCPQAADALAANYSVIIEAISLKPADRRSFAAVAAAAGVPFLGLWLVAAAAAMDRRSRARCHEASDASPEVLAPTAPAGCRDNGLGSHRRGCRHAGVSVSGTPRSRC